MEEAQDLSDLLLGTHEEYQQLTVKHHSLDDRLHEHTRKAYLSHDEHIEEVSLKKRKLLLKDRMEEILREYRTGTSNAVASA